jgi:hypothetical protein
VKPGPNPAFAVVFPLRSVVEGALYDDVFWPDDVFPDVVVPLTAVGVDIVVSGAVAVRKDFLFRLRSRLVRVHRHLLSRFLRPAVKTAGTDSVRVPRPLLSEMTETARPGIIPGRVRAALRAAAITLDLPTGEHDDKLCR